jgi:AcrR family transcriptional regulator
MATPRTKPPADRRSGPRPDPTAGTVARRAPFSDNPEVGTRGQRTQQRILDAALRVFGEHGYHRASIDRIARLGGCSRVSFYQYFASKEDVFRHLAAQMARQVAALTDALDPVTADVAGRAALLTWVSRYGEICARYEVILSAYETDDALSSIARGTGAQAVTRISSRLDASTVPSRSLDPVLRLLLQSLNHTLLIAGVLRARAPEAYPPDRLDGAIANVLHRALFGVLAGVNDHPGAGPPPPPLEVSPETTAWLQRDVEALEREGSENRAFTALLAAGRDVFVSRGYHNTRVDDLVSAAGVSHGAFYRYFGSKDHLARILTARAVQAAGSALRELPDLATLQAADGPRALRAWLRRYRAAEGRDAAMLRVWIDAAFQDPVLRAESAPPLEWGRRRLARDLSPRGFGDPEMDAVVLVGLLGVFGVQPRGAEDIEAAAQIIERGLIGR